MKNCPDLDLLQQFFRGNLNSAEFDAVGNHVENCEGCQSLVSRLADQEPASIAPSTDRPNRKSGDALPTGMLQRMAIQLANLSPGDHLRSKTGVITDADHPNSDGFTTPKQIGDYRIIREIDRGGMGTVFLAEHVRLKRLVAAKLMNKPKNRQLQARFFREMEVATEDRKESNSFFCALCALSRP